MKITDVILTKSYTGFYFDDQLAIKRGAKKDGLFYVGDPLTVGFDHIRVPGEAISIQLILADGSIAYGDCAAVQYSGTGGRDPLFLADEFMPFIEEHIVPELLTEDLICFRDLAEKYDKMTVMGKRLHTAIRYGLTQALLMGVAHAKKLTMAEVIRNEYNPKNEILKPVPIFAQSGDERYQNVDKMIIKEMDGLPHALINNVPEKLGEHGELLLEYVIWLRNRIIEKRLNENYNPIIHIDVYGTIGIAFNNDIEKIIPYLESLEKAAQPFKIRIEGPVDTGSKASTLELLKEITSRVDELNINLEIVADEWCNTLEDIKYFADEKAAHMLQIKSPDLGGLNNTAEAILYCKEKGILAYTGGTCNETDISAQATTNVSIACEADIILAKPAMDVDSGYMIVKNEMERIIARANRKK